MLSPGGALRHLVGFGSACASRRTLRLVQRASCAVIRFYVANIRRPPLRRGHEARCHGAEIEAARRCLRRPAQTAQAAIGVGAK